MLHRLDRVEKALSELDELIAEACRSWAHQLDLLQTIPGVGPKVAQVILAETGGDMSRFPAAAHLAAWAGLAPGVHESAAGGCRGRCPAPWSAAPSPGDPAKTGGAHQALHGAPGHRLALPVELGMDLAGPGDPEVLTVHPLDQRVGGRVADRPRRGRPGPEA